MKRLAFPLAILTGVAIGAADAMPHAAHSVWMKLTGQALNCPWASLLYEPLFRFNHARNRFGIRPRMDDRSGKLRCFTTPLGDFWIQRGGRDIDEMGLMQFLLNEQAALNALLAGRSIQPGDVVVDVGAHIGTFGRDALRRGASRVVMVEPDPLNMDCLRRNFRQEIAAGKVTLISKGAWSRAGRLRFSPGVSNSGTGSFIVDQPAGHSLELEVDRLDNLLAQAGVTRVDFLKLDIEGAEREALRGAFETMRRDRPRILLDAYHLPDDPVVLPAVIAEAVPAYKGGCFACVIRRTGSGVAAIPYAYLFEASRDGASSASRKAQ